MRGLRQIIGISGLLSTVLVLVGLLGGTPPGIDDSGQAVLDYAHDHRAFIITFCFLFGIATCLTLVFFGGLRKLLASPEPTRDVWPSVMFGSAIVVFTFGLAAQAAAAALAFRSPAHTPETARTLWDLFVVLLNASNLATIVLGVAAAIATLQSSVLPRWTGYLAVLFALAHFGATVSWARDGAFSQTGAFPTLAPLVYLVWVVAVSIVLLRAPERLGDT